MSENEQPAKREILRTGTYLHCYCPHCQMDLATENWVRLLVEGTNRSAGELLLSPRFNIFQREFRVPLEEGVGIRDLRCPGCNESLALSDRRCTRCGSQAVKLRVAVVDLDLDLFFCMRAGCPWHGLSTEDEKRIALGGISET